MATKYENDVLMPGFSDYSDTGYVSVEYLPDHRVLVTGSNYKDRKQFHLKIAPVVVDTVEDMVALEMGRKILKHVKQGE